MEALAAQHGWDTAHDTKFLVFPEGRISPYDERMPLFAKEAADALDVIVAQRSSNPAPVIFLEHLQNAGAFTVYELDDDLFNIDPKSNPTGHEFYSKPEIREGIVRSIAGSARVTVSTPKLAEIMSKYNSDIRICPNAIPDWLIEQEIERPEDRPVTIGWGGSQTHRMDFDECKSQLQRLFRWRDDITFHTIGANYIGHLLPTNRPYRVSGWFQSVPEYYKAIDFDIGIAPLRPHLFNQSKSYIKALEYAALGIPVVASDVGPYRDFVRHGETGFLVRREHEWTRYLRELIEDPAMRAGMGAAARELAANYTTSKLLPNWLEALTP
jgi:hypothetical protein